MSRRWRTLATILERKSLCIQIQTSNCYKSRPFSFAHIRFAAVGVKNQAWNQTIGVRERRQRLTHPTELGRAVARRATQSEGKCTEHIVVESDQQEKEEATLMDSASTTSTTAASRSRRRRHRGYLVYCDARWNENYETYRQFVEKERAKNERTVHEEETALPLPDNKRLRDWLHRQTFSYRQRQKPHSRQVAASPARQRQLPQQVHNERFQKLRLLGFRPDEQPPRRERSWDKMYQQLCDYLQQTNGVYPDDTRSTDQSKRRRRRNVGMDLGSLSTTDEHQRRRLHVWCRQQRRHYNLYQRRQENAARGSALETKGSLLTADRIDLLNRISFAWSYRDAQWDIMYAQLQAFYRHFGHCLVPANYVSNPTLAKWVDTQRQQYRLSVAAVTVAAAEANVSNRQSKSSAKEPAKKRGLDPRRLALLNQLDFVWDAYEYKWLERYNELKAYQDLNGHGVLPRYKDTERSMKSLYRWIKHQQAEHRKWSANATAAAAADGGSRSSTMTAARKAKLEQLGVPLE